MEEEVTMTDTKSNKPDLALWIGIAAVVINIITVSVYMYQAYIMQEQQHASAWPYVEWLPSFNEETYFIEITNNGIGPAIIKNMNIQLDRKTSGKPRLTLCATSLNNLFSSFNLNRAKPGIATGQVHSSFSD